MQQGIVFQSPISIGPVGPVVLWQLWTQAFMFQDLFAALSCKEINKKPICSTLTDVGLFRLCLPHLPWGQWLAPLTLHLTSLLTAGPPNYQPAWLALCLLLYTWRQYDVNLAIWYGNDNFTTAVTSYLYPTILRLIFSSTCLETRLTNMVNTTSGSPFEWQE